jgi:predicted ATP-grasp superfamily ATP-dependent carboligase
LNNVLITYAWVRSSYAILRNLKSHSLNVSVSDTNFFGMCQFSKFTKKVHCYTSHYKDEKKFINDLLKITKIYKVSLLFPSHNETEIIARHRDLFEPSLVSLIPKLEHCTLFNNKSKTYDFVESLGIKIPQRLFYKNPLDINELIIKSKFKKVVIKLLTGNSAKGVFYPKTPLQAQRLVINLIKEYRLSSDSYPQIEEFVHGEGYGASFLYWHGKSIAYFTHKRLREKITTGGTSTLREHAIHRGIEAASVKIFNSIGWHGLAMAEFKVCPKTGKFWFIEVNPRVWGSISLAINAGVEFPYLAWLCATKGPEIALQYKKKCNVEKKWIARWLLGDILLALKEIIKLNPKLAYEILFGKRVNSVDDFYIDDPLVFIGEISRYLLNSLMKLSFNPAEKGMLK